MYSANAFQEVMCYKTSYFPVSRLSHYITMMSLSSPHVVILFDVRSHQFAIKVVGHLEIQVSLHDRSHDRGSKSCVFKCHKKVK